ADRWAGILAHELAHLARRDHWVVRLELLVEAVWWWNPLFRHARRQLHEEAERACDARVVRSLPERRFAYAEALVDVCEHLARTAIPKPALGVGGAGASRSLEGRLLMILRDPIPRRPSRRTALAALLLAALALPAWTLGQQPDEPQPGPAAPSPKPDPSPNLILPDPQPKPDPTPKPGSIDVTRPVVPASRPSQAASAATIDTIRAAQRKRVEMLGNLAFRYVVSGRDQFYRSPGMVEMMNKRMGGQAMSSPGMVEMMNRRMGEPGVMGGGSGNPGMGGPAMKKAARIPAIQRRKIVSVEAAEIVLGLGSRIDVIAALPADGPPASGRILPVHWARRFVARDLSGIMTLET